MSTVPELPNVFACYSNHFDLIWRRGWQRNYEYGGLNYRCYADVEDAIITEWLRLAVEQGAAFQIEQALSLREYLKRHPETLTLFQELSKAGRFELLGSGEAIIDVNMCSGETMARNMASGVVYAQRILGQKTTLVCHNDGFGSSAQFPQVARQCGLRGIAEMSYSLPDAPYWRGLDGSTVYFVGERPGKCFWHDHCYYEPCLVCRGHGTIDASMCSKCRGTGLRLSQGVYPAREDWNPESNSPYNFYVVTSEEMLPDDTIAEYVSSKAQEGLASWSWKTQASMVPLWEDALARVDDSDIPLSSRVENNPCQTGTLVTRSRMKRAAREAEAWFYTNEKFASLASFVAGAVSVAEIKEKIEPAWLSLPLLFFHDAVNGTHIDPALTELLDIAAEVVTTSRSVGSQAASFLFNGDSALKSEDLPTTIAVFNPHSFAASLFVDIPMSGGNFAVLDHRGRSVATYRQPSSGAPDEGQPLEVGMNTNALQAVGQAHWLKNDAEAPRSLSFLAAHIPPLSTRVFTITPVTAAERREVISPIAVDGYVVGWDDHGVNSIVDQASGRELLPSGEFRLGTIVLEEDRGDPWGVRYIERARTSTCCMTRLISAKRSGASTELVFGGKFENGSFGREKHPTVFGLEWLQVVRFMDGLPWFDVDFEIFWAGVDHRIKAFFPTQTATDRAIYDIPYGTLRRERYDSTETCLWSPNGDWPTLRYVATEPDGEHPGLAVINTGTPAVRVEDGFIQYSMIRSPAFGHCLTRYAQEYPMPTADMRDPGYHQFQFKVMPHNGANLSDVMRAAAIANEHTLTFPVPHGTAEWSSGVALTDTGASITAIKPQFTGNGLAVRVVEQVGIQRDVTIALPSHVKRVRSANLLEEPDSSLSIQNGHVTVTLRPYEIHTLLFDAQ